jgi:hypothetical protein
VKGHDICDGCGNSWSRCKLGADCGLYVAQPGKAQCWCHDQEASRAKVRSAREEIAKLESDNERLRKESKAAKIDRDAAGWGDYAVISELKRENAALRADSARLDWLARNRSVSSSERPIGVTPESLRDSIDAARKEAQP